MGCDSWMCRPLPKLAEITLLFKIRMRCGDGDELEESAVSFVKIAVLRTI